MKKPKTKPKFSAFSNFLWTVKMMTKYCKSALAITLLLVPIAVGLRYLEIYLPSLVVSEVTAGNRLSHALLSVGAVMLLMLCGYLLTQALGQIRTASMGVYRYKMTDLLTRKQLSLFYQTHERKDVRDLAERATRATQMWNGAQPLTDMVYHSFGMAENLLGYLLFGSVISFASPWLVPILTVAPAVNYFAARAYNKWEYANRSHVWEVRRRLGYVEQVPDDFAAGKDIRIYSMASWLKECYKALSAEHTAWDKKETRKSFLSRIADLVVILLRDGGAYALLISMFASGEITVEQFVLYFAAISSFAGWVGGIISRWNALHSTSLQLCDFREYTEYPEEDGTGEAKAEDHLHTPPEITFRNVSYRYHGAEEDTLHDLSFTVKAGEKLALVGLNGAGKTTLVKLLCGLYAPTEGEILYNGVPLSHFKREDYYRLISPVFQDVRTAFFSLAETVSCASLENTDLQKAEACLRRAGLGEKIDSLPQGILTRLNKAVNKEGTELSGGEAQKLMLARALYKDAPLLILDEPTAALDPLAESRIYTEFNQMAKEKTSLFISHRLASTAFCHRILLLEKGVIAEEGSHAELLAKGGKYKELFDIQSCWYRDNEEGGARA